MLHQSGARPQTSLQFALRLSSTVFAVRLLQRRLVRLGHSITALLERERHIFFFT